jgi:PiT family inorganic phosphate transporter
MTDVAALPGLIEPARRGPDLGSGFNPLAAILFAGVVGAALLFVAYSIYTDIDASGTRITNYVPFLLLFVALLIALGFEFVNGFHDTANAVATVIYTRSLPANFAVGRACSIWPASCGHRARWLSASSPCCRSS